MVVYYARDAQLAAYVRQATPPFQQTQYSEDPAVFKPLTDEELHRIKKERRQKDLQRKQKAAENRKHLANVRVVQRNLVFVVGLSQRLADQDVLRRVDYFGKYGKIHKVVINQSTSYAGAQGPSASAYVTYLRYQDALRAISAVNNIHVDGRTLKASLGTTKYCSHFLRGSQCPKPDCMYLHELGEEAASFTKEEMQQGKHQEYEQRLQDHFMNSQNITNTIQNTSKISSNRMSPHTIGSDEDSSTGLSDNSGSPGLCETGPTLNGSLNGSSNWPLLPDRLSNDPVPNGLMSGTGTHDIFSTSKPDLISNGGSMGSLGNTSPIGTSYHSHTHSSSSSEEDSSPGDSLSCHSPPNSRLSGVTTNGTLPVSSQMSAGTTIAGTISGSSGTTNGPVPHSPPHNNMHAITHQALSGLSGLCLSGNSYIENPADSMSLFSSNGFNSTAAAVAASRKAQQANKPQEGMADIPDVIPVDSTTDWSAAFGFTNNLDTHDDDLGFDPWDESTKALADMIEKEATNQTNTLFSGSLPPSMPPAFPSQFHTGGHTTEAHTHMGIPHGGPTTAPPPGLQHPHHHSHPAASHQGGLMSTGTPQVGQHTQQHTTTGQPIAGQPTAKCLPPGFTPSHIAHSTAMYNNHLGNTHTGVGSSKMLSLMQLQQASVPTSIHNYTPEALDGANTQNLQNPNDWQDGLRALLPNINISFGSALPSNLMQERPSAQKPSWTEHTGPMTSHAGPMGDHTGPMHHQMDPSGHKDLSGSTDIPTDPAIVTQASLREALNSGALNSGDEPHWMASLHHLTDEGSQHRLPFAQQFPSNNSSWASSTMTQPPPGFQTQSHSNTHLTDTHQLTEGL